MADKVISTHTHSTAWYTSTTATFLWQNGDSTYFKTNLKEAFDLKSNTSAASTWILVTYSSNWVNYSTTFAPTSYKKDSAGFVHFRLGCKSGASNPVCILPVGYRPDYTLQYWCYSAGTSTGYDANFNIDTSGNVNLYAHTNTTVLMGEIIYTPLT